METATVHIGGCDEESLIEAMKEGLDDYYFYTYDKVTIFCLEKYYFRVKSNLMTVIILDFSEPGQCTVELNSGGGGEGLLGITWGSEDSSNRKAIDLIIDLCKTKNWQFSEVDEEKEQ